MAHSEWTEASPAQLALIQGSGTGTSERALAGVAAALSDLRGLERADTVVGSGLRALIAHCGFARASLYAVMPGRLRVLGTHGPGDLPTVDSEIPIPSGDVAEALRRQTALIATRSSANLIDQTGAGAALAPVAPGGAAIALLVADRPCDGRPLDRRDRDMLRAFAEGFGFAVHSAAVQERLVAQRRHFQRLTMTGEAIMTELCEEPVTLAAPVDHEWAALPMHAAGTIGSDQRPGRDPLLSARELEVLGLITEGARNREIAARLCLSEDTVKSHVRRILRKLHATNRAEAVSRYHRLPGHG